MSYLDKNSFSCDNLFEIRFEIGTRDPSTSNTS